MLLCFVNYDQTEMHTKEYAVDMYCRSLDCMMYNTRTHWHTHMDGLIKGMTSQHPSPYEYEAMTKVHVHLASLPQCVCENVYELLWKKITNLDKFKDRKEWFPHLMNIFVFPHSVMHPQYLPLLPSFPPCLAAGQFSNIVMEQKKIDFSRALSVISGYEITNQLLV